MPTKCAVIIVTNNSERHITKAMECLREQTQQASQIILVDTGSDDTSYLKVFKEAEVVIGEKGIGFCRGNNLGMKKVSPSTDYVFFLNPDAFLTPTFLEKASTFMEANPKYGALTGTTLGYDIETDKPTGKYDTTGIFRTWYGKWYDRGQGMAYDPEMYRHAEEIPAICGAVFFCRMRALDTVIIRSTEVFDSSFFMYKEDIDLSLRLRKKGWKLAFVPNLTCYHCRGWNQQRSKVPRVFRLCSARNELRLQLKSFSPIGALYSSVKYATVKLFDL